MNTNTIEITAASILTVSKAILGTGPRVDRDTYKAHVPAFVSKSGVIVSSTSQSDALMKPLTPTVQLITAPEKSQVQLLKEDNPTPLIAEFAKQQAEIRKIRSKDFKNSSDEECNFENATDEECNAWKKLQEKVNTAFGIAINHNATRCIAAIVDFYTTGKQGFLAYGKNQVDGHYVQLFGINIGVEIPFNEKFEVSYKSLNTCRYTPLCIAAAGASLKTVNMLLAAGANPRTESECRCPGTFNNRGHWQIENLPVALAAVNKRTEVLELILHAYTEEELKAFAQKWEISHFHINGSVDHSEAGVLVRETAKQVLRTKLESRHAGIQKELASIQ